MSKINLSSDFKIKLTFPHVALTHLNLSLILICATAKRWLMQLLPKNILIQNKSVKTNEKLIKFYSVKMNVNWDFITFCITVYWEKWASGLASILNTG